MRQGSQLRCNLCLCVQPCTSLISMDSSGRKIMHNNYVYGSIHSKTVNIILLQVRKTCQDFSQWLYDSIKGVLLPPPSSSCSPTSFSLVSKSFHSLSKRTTLALLPRVLRTQLTPARQTGLKQKETSCINGVNNLMLEPSI